MSDDSHISFGSWAKQWGHLSVTVTLGIFLWTQYQASETLRQEMRTQIAINAQALEQLTVTLQAVNARFEIQRDDITALRQQLLEHARLEAQRAEQRRGGSSRG
jgi:hypothetical protein